MTITRRTRRRYSTHARQLIDTHNDLSKAATRLRKLADYLNELERWKAATTAWADRHGYVLTD